MGKRKEAGLPMVANEDEFAEVRGRTRISKSAFESEDLPMATGK